MNIYIYKYLFFSSIKIYIIIIIKWNKQYEKNFTTNVLHN